MLLLNCKINIMNWKLIIIKINININSNNLFTSKLGGNIGSCMHVVLSIKQEVYQYSIHIIFYSIIFYSFVSISVVQYHILSFLIPTKLAINRHMPINKAKIIVLWNFNLHSFAFIWPICLHLYYIFTLSFKVSSQIFLHFMSPN